MISAFSQKILKGLRPSDQDWEEHLRQTHARVPRMTPEAFNRFRNDKGENSYQILAREPAGADGDVSVIDLGCGDGHLIPHLLKNLSARSSVIAVDMVQEGLDLGRAEILDSRVKWLHARAQDLPVSDRSVDFVLSHMSFMLMAPIEPVIAEIKRVLKPGGVFAAVVGGGEADGVLKEVHRLASVYARTHIPEYLHARATRFAEQFGVSLQEHSFQVSDHLLPEELWRYLEGMYFTELFTEIVRRELKNDVLSIARNYMDSSGLIPVSVPMRLYKATLALPPA